MDNLTQIKAKLAVFSNHLEDLSHEFAEQVSEFRNYVSDLEAGSEAQD